MTTNRILTFVALAVSASACGSDPVNYSAPVGIELKAKSGDVQNGVISENKDITTESGNPYGAFVNDAKAKLGGKDPTEIEVDRATLTLGGQSTGVTKLEEVFTGDVDVSMVINDSNNTYDVAHVTGPTGIGPVDMTVVFDGTKVSSTDMPKLLGGGFKIVLRGNAATGFMSKGAEASLQVTLTFDAFK